MDIRTWRSDLEAELSIVWLPVVSKVSVAGQVSVLLELGQAIMAGGSLPLLRY